MNGRLEGTVIAERIGQAYAAAVFAKDAAAFTALYADDVRVFDLWTRWSYNGRAEWRTMVDTWFASLGTDQVRVKFTGLFGMATDTLCTAHAFISYAAISAEGLELHGMQNRLTWVLERRAQAWLIVHEHTSAPIDSDSMKVQLKHL
jgi:ketosteroid isomerase-like protein